MIALNLLHCKCHEIYLKNGGSYIDSPNWIENKTRSTTAVDPQHLKVKQQGISLPRNYSIIVSIQIITSIHTFILKIQQILESHELKDKYHL